MPLSELSIGFTAWILLVAIGGLVAVDAVSWPQFMISRPLISATIGGAVAGHAAAGMLVGVVLELYFMRHAPLGAARYPDSGPAGLVAGASFAATGGDSLGALVTALIAGWALGWVGYVTVHALRRANERLVTPAARLAARPALVEQRHRLAMWLDVARGALLVAAFLIPVAIAAGLAVGVSLSRPEVGYATVALLLGLVAATGASARATAFGLRGWSLLILGGGVTLIGLLVTR